MNILIKKQDKTKTRDSQIQQNDYLDLNTWRYRDDCMTACFMNFLVLFYYNACFMVAFYSESNFLQAVGPGRGRARENAHGVHVAGPHQIPRGGELSSTRPHRFNHQAEAGPR